MPRDTPRQPADEKPYARPTYWRTHPPAPTPHPNPNPSRTTVDTVADASRRSSGSSGALSPRKLELAHLLNSPEYEALAPGTTITSTSTGQNAQSHDRTSTSQGMGIGLGGMMTTRPLDRRVSHSRDRDRLEDAHEQDISPEDESRMGQMVAVKQEPMDLGEMHSGLGSHDSMRSITVDARSSESSSRFPPPAHTFSTTGASGASTNISHVKSEPTNHSLAPLTYRRDLAPHSPIQVHSDTTLPPSSSNVSKTPGRVKRKIDSASAPDPATGPGTNTDTGRTGHTGGSAWTSEELLLAFRYAIKYGAPGSEKAWEGVVPGKSGNAVRMAWRYVLFP